MKEELALAAGNSVEKSRTWKCNFEGMKEMCSSFFLPFMIGVATVVVSIIQLHIANKQREQDLAIAARNRDQDLAIANHARWDSILSTYIEEVSELMGSESYASIAENSALKKLLRAKTLTASLQLDTTRRACLIHFLYDIGALNVEDNPLDLRTISLNDIILNAPSWFAYGLYSLENISLVGAHLVNSSFAELKLCNANFTLSYLSGAVFMAADLSGAVFHLASLRNADFTFAVFTDSEFTFSDLRGSNIEDYQLRQANALTMTVLPNGTLFRNPSLLINGDAEYEAVCSKTNVTILESNHWIASPPRSISIMDLQERVVRKDLDEEDLRLRDNAVENNVLLMILRNITSKLGRCAFIFDPNRNGSMAQHFDIPEHYRTDLRPYVWLVVGTCAGLDEDVHAVDIMINLIEFDDRGQAINSYEYSKCPE